jgi:hypothetical protein
MAGGRAKQTINWSTEDELWGLCVSNNPARMRPRDLPLSNLESLDLTLDHHPCHSPNLESLDATPGIRA